MPSDEVVDARPGIDRPLRLLFLCSHRTYLRKMSRVRFHSMSAIGRVAELTWSGNGWDGYDERKPVQANIDAIYGDAPGPDLVVAYKPLELLGFGDTRPPRCIRYIEMYDADWTWKEIADSRANLVVCHYRNELEEWQRRLRGYSGHPLKLVSISHCAEQTIYRDYGLAKTRDLLLVGAFGARTELGVVYPLRERMVGILQRMSSRYRCEIHLHPGYDLDDAWTDRNSVLYAKAINSSKICVTCSGAPRSRFSKYIEIPMAGSALAADLPGEDQEFFRRFIIEIDRSYSDERIIDTLSYYLENDSERQALVRRGLESSGSFTQERYAERFVEEATLFLDELRSDGF